MTTPNNAETSRVPKTVQLILLSGRIGIIANAIAEQLNIEPMRALELFYESDTCRRLHDERTGLYLRGELYIVDDFIMEMQNKQ